MSIGYSYTGPILLSFLLQDGKADGEVFEMGEQTPPTETRSTFNLVQQVFSDHLLRAKQHPSATVDR